MLGAIIGDVVGSRFEFNNSPQQLIINSIGKLSAPISFLNLSTPLSSSNILMTLIYSRT